MGNKEIVLMLLEVIRQILNSSNLKAEDDAFYYKVKDFCCDAINSA